MGLNKLLLRFRHAFIVFMAAVLYMAVNWLGCIMYGGRPVYASVVVWYPNSATPGAGLLPDRDEWNSFGLFFCLFVGGMPVLFLLFVLIHRYKFICCKGE